MKDLNQLDGVLIGSMLGMVVCFILFLTFTFTPIVIKYFLELYWNRGGGERIRKRNCWRKKLGLPKLKN